MNPKLKSYEEDERYLLEILLSHFKTIENYNFTSGRICYDAEIFLKNKKTILSEVKVRKFKIDTYPDYILQVDKLISLINKAKTKGNDLIYYINFFKSEYKNRKDFIIFNLTPRIMEWKTNKPTVINKWMNAETCVDNPNKISKQVIMLNYNPKIDCMGNFYIN